MVRVIAGTARNLQLKTPEGLNTRPTTDRIKETLFNMLQFDLPGCVFVDLFAGSGQIGIESLSRGAKRAYFIENDRNALLCINDNIKHTHFEDKSTVFSVDVLSGINLINESAVGYIFMDPPYEAGFESAVLSALKDKKYITEDTVIIVEALLDKDFSFAEELGYTITKEKKYKSNKHVFLSCK